jgi:hypothetical protein
MAETEKRGLSEQELQELVSASDSGARQVSGAIGTFIALVALAWSIFQVMLASPVAPYVLPSDMINNARQIHLAFAIFLSAMAYPLFRSAPRDRVPWYDWILAVGGAFLAMYGYFFYEKIVSNGGLADDMDAAFALAGLIFLFIAAYRDARPGDGRAGADLPRLRVLRRVRAGARPDPLGRSLAPQGDEPHVDHLGGGLRDRARGLHQVRLPLRPLRRAPRQGGGGQLLHQDGLRGARPPARRAGQGRRRGVCRDRPDLRLLDRQRGHHGHLHHPADETRGLLGREGRRGRGPRPRSTARSCPR